MTAQPGTPGPDTGSYEVIHLGGQAAVVVPVADFLRLRALEQAASPAELEDRRGIRSSPAGAFVPSPATAAADLTFCQDATSRNCSRCWRVMSRLPVFT